MKFTIFLMSAAFLWPAAVPATTYVVRPDGTGDFPTIQAAIDAAVNGDTIELTNGSFTGDGNRDISVVGKAITIRSQSGDPENCIIDCQGVGWGIYLGWTTGRSKLEGFMVTRGQADSGGGVTDDSYPGADIADCIFYRNSAAFVGGGVMSRGEAAALVRCKFVENSSGEFAGGFFSGSNGPTHATLDDCQFIGNTASRFGGAVFLDAVYPMREGSIRNCTFVGNRSLGRGGAVYVTSQSPTIEHCTFAYNAAATGGVVDCPWSAPTIRNSIIAFSTEGAAVSCEDGGPAVLDCCDVYGNAGGDWVGCIAGQEGQNGNLGADPLFCDPEVGDLRLQEGSPCGPDYNPDCGQIGAWPVGCGPSAIEEMTWGAVKAMYR